MTRISSLNAASSNNLFSILARSRENAGPSPSDSDAPSSSPQDFLTSELQDQGYTGTALDDLLAKIQEAVKSVQGADGQRPKPGALHDAINKVLKDAGVDTDKIDQGFAARGPRPPHDADSSQGSGIDELLATLGIDPKQFESALLAAIQNPGSDGKLDLSQLFATAVPGSQLDLHA
jgi:hypothetical protein